MRESEGRKLLMLCESIDNMSHSELIESLDSHANDHGTEIEKLPEGLRLYTLGKGQKLFFIVSGLHGNERAGPVFLYQLIESGFLPPPEFRIKICPIACPQAWDAQSREVNGKNANRLWNSKATPSIQALMADLKRQVPDIYLDLHEDDECKGPADSHYLFRNVDSSWGRMMQRELGVSTRKGVWRHPDGKTSESFAFSLGCKNSATIESNSHRSLGNRVQFQRDALNAAFKVWTQQNVSN